MANTIYPINNRKASYGDLSHLSPVIDDNTYELLPYAVENIQHIDNIGNLKNGITIKYNLNGDYGDFPLKSEIDDLTFDLGYSQVDVADDDESPEMYNINVDKETVFDVQTYYPLSKTIGLTINGELFYYNDTYIYPLKDVTYDESDLDFIIEMNNNDFTPNYISYNGYKQKCIAYRVNSYDTNTKQVTPIMVSVNSPIAMSPNSKALETYTSTIKKIKNKEPKADNSEIGYGVMIAPSQKNSTPYILYYKFSILQSLTGKTYYGRYLHLPLILNIQILYQQSHHKDQQNYCKFSRCGVGGTLLPYDIDNNGIYTADNIYNYMYNTTDEDLWKTNYNIFSAHDNDIIYIWTTMQTEYHTNKGAEKRTYLDMTNWGGHFTHRIIITINSQQICDVPIASSKKGNYTKITDDSVLATYTKCAVNSNFTTEQSIQQILSVLPGFDTDNNAMLPLTEYTKFIIYKNNSFQCYYKDYTYGKLTVRHCVINYSCPISIVDSNRYDRNYNGATIWEFE